MTMFGLKEAEVAELVRRVASPDLDRDGIQERFARAVWSGVTEPGDAIAGYLVSALGAGRALGALVERRDPDDVLDAVFDAVGEQGELGARDVQLAFDRWSPRLDSSASLAALRQAGRIGVRLLVPGEPEWPAGVDDLRLHAPLALWARGRVEALGALERSFALVGARAATGYGEHITMETSAALCERGFAIVSGAAYGIDGIAHRAALATDGTTLAFLAGGTDRFYPSGHDALLSRIVERGLVLSELPCGAQPTKWRFLQRNRLIAASSRATVVLEAGWRSGSLNTAHHAASLDRPVGAFPGPVTSAASAGCHRLVREQRATLVTAVDEVLALLPDADPGLEPDTGTDDSHRTRVLDALSTRSSRAVSDIAARCGMSLGEVRAVLGELELDGLAAESERGWVRRVPTVGRRA